MDNATGIGGWSEKPFIMALHTGKHAGVGRSILPPMPWRNLVGAEEEDLKAMFALFQSLPPINNKVPKAIPPDELTK